MKNSWRRERAVAEKDYGYFSGCSLEGTAMEYNTSMQLILKTLGVTFHEPDDWSCCGSTPAHSVDHALAAALAARNLAIVERMGLDTLITPCPACLSAFKKAHLRMAKDAEFKSEVNGLLDEPYHGGVMPKSALQVLYEDIGIDEAAKKVTHAFPDLKVAPYYGCILNRPPEIAQFDDPENPVAMDKIITAVGIKVCDFAFKVECCGAAFGVPKRKMVNKLTSKVLSMALDAGANCIAVACPLCQQNLDLRQDQVNATMDSSFNIPVLYFSQIMGLTYGYSPKELGLDKLTVNPDRVINSRISVEELARQEKEKAEKDKLEKPKKVKAKEEEEA